MPGTAALRRTPGPSHVRLAALSLFAQGLGIGFLGILISSHALFAEPSGYGVAAAVLGTMLAAFPAHRLAPSERAGQAALAYVAGCSIVAAAGLIAASAMVPPAGGVAALLLLGLSAGAALRLSVAVVLPMLPARGGPSLLGLAGASFGLGGLAACLIATAVYSALSAVLLPLCAASAPALIVRAALLAWQHGSVAAVQPVAAASSPSGTGPRSLLMAASLLLQAVGCGVAACWFAVYFTRGVGLSGMHAAAAASGVLWLSLAVGWALALRLPRIQRSLRALAAPLALVATGSALLLWPPWPPLAALGGAFLGMGMGVLFPLTLRLTPWPTALGECRWMTRLLHWALPAALLLNWAAAALSQAAEVTVLVWWALACFLGAVAALALMIGDFRISGDRALI